VGAGEITDGRHVGGPAAQVHHGDGLGARGDQRGDGGGGDGTRVDIHIGKYWLGNEQHSTGGGGDEGARRCDQLIALAETDGQIGGRQRQGAIGHGDGMATATPMGELLLEGLRLLACPSIHLTGSEHTGGGINLVGVEPGPGGKIDH